MLDIFDNVGHVRDLSSETDVAAIEALPTDQREILIKCLAACRDAEAGEARLAEARRNRELKNREYNAALAAEVAANPPILEHEAGRLVARANGSIVTAAKPRKSNEKTRAALAAATEAQSEARAEYSRSEVALRALSAARGDAILAYMNSGEKITPEKIAREYQQRSQAARAAVAERQAIADQTAPVTAGPVHLSELDKTLSARGKTANRTQKYLGAR